MECRYIDDCAMFPRIRDAETRQHYVVEFCRGPRNIDCERFKIRVQGMPIPVDLLPDGGTIDEL